MTNSLDMLCEAASRLRLGIPCVLADENPCLGGSHRVFKIIFEDSVQWAARASDDSLNWENELRAVRQFRHIKKQRPKLKAPDLFVDKEYPVVYSEWKSCLYSTWLTESLDRGLWRTLKGTARWGNVINFLIMRSMIPDHAAEYDGYSSISFAHGDLHACNIMKSEEFHLTG
ncbi:hypothetical protein BDW42DRAFT_186449 [Aspergillus taichungensis]|uniref:Aminoglycoside phosphotransferase domain-containing protein n=1 Tax=Aspergillus taichungensis TaxID=482145 RepID=A0A2J5HRD6_9EURO|nr:hypothetical protein BDW42DRAFT_186449 [Aspergillus taichungensis]